MPDGRVVPDERRPGRGGGGAGVDPARVRRRAAAPAAEAARGADAARRAALEGGRGGGAARHSVASVNSALQRARATLAATDVSDDATAAGRSSREQRELLARYVDAFERYDMDALTALLHEDALLSMPPFELWLRGARRHHARGASGRASGARARGWSRRRRTASPAFGAVPAERPTAGRAVGAAGAWRSRATGSPGSRSSSTPSTCSRCSGCRRGSTPDPPARGNARSRPESSRRAQRSSPGAPSTIRPPSACAASCMRASASTVQASGSVTAATSHTIGPAPERSIRTRTRSHSAGISPGLDRAPKDQGDRHVRERRPAGRRGIIAFDRGGSAGGLSGRARAGPGRLHRRRQRAARDLVGRPIEVRDRAGARAFPLREYPMTSSWRVISLVPEGSPIDEVLDHVEWTWSHRIRIDVSTWLPLSRRHGLPLIGVDPDRPEVSLGGRGLCGGAKDPLSRDTGGVKDDVGAQAVFDQGDALGDRGGLEPRGARLEVGDVALDDAHPGVDPPSAGLVSGSEPLEGNLPRPAILPRLRRIRSRRSVRRMPRRRRPGIRSARTPTRGSSRCFARPRRSRSSGRSGWVGRVAPVCRRYRRSRWNRGSAGPSRRRRPRRSRSREAGARLRVGRRSRLLLGACDPLLSELRELVVVAVGVGQARDRR